VPKKTKTANPILKPAQSYLPCLRIVQGQEHQE